MVDVDELNVLFITLDQFRGDSLSAAGHPLVRTPNLDELARQGTRFARHYTQSTPCAPGRAGLYTGMYQMNHRVVANGTPLDRRFDNIALLARRAGRRPVLFGYTDQSIDPRVTSGPDDPRLLTYEGLLPGMDWELDLSGPHQPWVDHLARLGHDVSGGHLRLLDTECDRPAEHGLSAFTTDHIIEFLEKQNPSAPWFVHASYLRPHPPYSAPGHFSTMYDPAEVGSPIAPADERHPFHDVLMAIDWVKRPATDDEMRNLRAQYYGMISAVDHEVGRLVAALKEVGQWDRTVVVITADHGEQLGDHGLVQKVGWFEESHHIPLLWRDPRRTGGNVVEHFTESVDVMPTLAESLGQPVPLQCDGLPLTPFLEGAEPVWWRTAASWEFDWRFALIPFGDYPWPWDRRLEEQHLAVRRTDDTAYVQFGDGSWLCYDIASDPTWRTPVTDPQRILDIAQDMLVWRSRHADRTHTGLLVENGGVGRWPDSVPWR
jgi:arylsulfatase A-like enzyme